jgi:ABC-type amino acid transport substrate-binding protein
VRKLATVSLVVMLAVGTGACSKHGAKNVYSCPDKGDGVGFTAVKKGKLTVQTALPAPRFWEGKTVDALTGGFEFELARDLCAQLGIGRVRIVDEPRAQIVAGTTSGFDIALAQIEITPDEATKADLSTAYSSADGKQLGVLLPNGSANTKLIDAAIGRLKAAGTLDALAKKWLTTN